MNEAPLNSPTALPTQSASSWLLILWPSCQLTPPVHTRSGMQHVRFSSASASSAASPIGVSAWRRVVAVEPAGEGWIGADGVEIFDL